LAGGAAALLIGNIPVFDAFTIPNSLTPAHPMGAPVTATISLHILWTSVSRQINHFSNAAGRFRGSFAETKVIVDVVANTPSMNFEAVTDPLSTVTNFAQIGHEADGFFFDHPCSEEEEDDEDERQDD
jgi:hypothetical protein